MSNDKWEKFCFFLDIQYGRCIQLWLMFVFVLSRLQKKLSILFVKDIKIVIVFLLFVINIFYFFSTFSILNHEFLYVNFALYETVLYKKKSLYRLSTISKAVTKIDISLKSQSECSRDYYIDIIEKYWLY